MTETLSEKLLRRFDEEELKQQLRECSRLENPIWRQTVFSLGRQVVAKRGYSNKSQKEYDIAMLLSDKGVRVPEMYGLMEIDIEGQSRPDCYLLMQEILGKEIKDVPEEDKEEADRQFRREILKVLRMGIKPSDAFFGRNAIFSEDRKLYLIDFEKWIVGASEKDLKPYYNLIERRNPEQ